MGGELESDIFKEEHTSKRGRVRHGKADTRGTHLRPRCPVGCADMAFTEHQTEVPRFAHGDLVDVVIVEDHRLYREGLTEMLAATDPQLRVTAACDSAEDALEVIPRLMPDVVLMDIHLSAMSGIDAIQRLGVLCPSIRVLVVSGSAEDHDILDAILAGACGYILKDAPIEQVAAGIRAAAHGGTTLSPVVASQLLDHVRQSGPPVSIGAEPVGQLTPRELEVLRLLAAGLENSEIAAELVISTRTARNHVASILEKLQMQNRIQAAVYAVRHGLA
jgi:DNA-binding NarL/FixJ family response regulator